MEGDFRKGNQGGKDQIIPGGSAGIGQEGYLCVNWGRVREGQREAAQPMGPAQPLPLWVPWDTQASESQAWSVKQNNEHLLHRLVE